MKVIADAQNLIEVPSKNYPCSNALLLFFRVWAQKNPTKPNHTKKKPKTSSRSTIEVVSSFLGIANGWKILCFQFMTAKFHVEDTDVFALESSACDSLAYSQH